MSKAAVDNFCVGIFLFVVLFLPTTGVFTRIYFAILLLITPLLLATKKIFFDWLSIIGLGILGVIIISTILRFAVVVEPNLRDYTEVARYLLPVLILIFRDRFKNLSVKTLFIVFALYCSADFLVSILDFTNTDILGVVSFIKKYYVNKGHADVYYRISGLSAGPGQHGTIMLVLFIFFFIRAFQSKRVLLPLFFSILAAIPMFLSQSRTSIIVFLLITISVPIYYLIVGGRSEKKRSIPILIAITGGGFYIFSLFITYFDRVVALLKIGGILQVSSIQDRIGHYESLFDKALEYPLFILLGYGKEFFKTSVFDSDYILMFLVHGPLITLVILVGIFTYLVNFLLKSNKVEYYYSTILFFLLLAGLFVAIPVSFFLQFSIMPILIIFSNLTYWESKAN